MKKIVRKFICWLFDIEDQMNHLQQSQKLLERCNEHFKQNMELFKEEKELHEKMREKFGRWQKMYDYIQQNSRHAASVSSNKFDHGWAVLCIGGSSEEVHFFDLKNEDLHFAYKHFQFLAELSGDRPRIIDANPFDRRCIKNELRNKPTNKRGF